MKTSELTGQQLDYWVAKAQGWEKGKGGIHLGLDFTHEGPNWLMDGDYQVEVCSYTPSTNGAQCFELMEIVYIAVDTYYVGAFYSASVWVKPNNFMAEGGTLNEAICRAFVASVYGEEVIYEQN